eukprot:gene12403-13687_t
MAALSKFTEEQLDLMEKAYVDGLSSTNMSLHAAKYERLSSGPNSDPSYSTASEPTATLEGSDQSLKRAPCNRRTSAWNLFLSRAFKGELKDVPKEEKSKLAKELYGNLSAEEKEKLEKEAKLDVDLESMAQEHIEKCICHSMQRVMKESKMADEDELEEAVRYYFLKDFEYDTILNFLEKYHGIKISKRKLQDRLKRYGLSRRTSQDNQIDEQRIRQYILLELDGPGRLLGYRALWRKLHLRYRITTPRSIVQTLLRELDPEGSRLRQAHRLKRRHNQRIEAWWAFLRRSWSSWWMDFFKDMVDSGSLDLINQLHCKCLWFCFSKTIQNELDSFQHFIVKKNTGARSHPSIKNLVFSNTRNATQKTHTEIKMAVFGGKMQYMEQFGCIGFCLSMKPNGKLLTASTIKWEEYLMSGNAMTRGFSEFCSLVTGIPTRVPYKNYQRTFRVEGWPDDVPFKTPARMGPTQLEKVMSVKDDISFIMLDPLVCHPASAPLNISNSSNPIAHSQEDNEDTVESSANEPQKKRGKRGKKVSFIRRCDIVPVYASQNNNSNEEDDQGTYRFWLFKCNSKVKTDGTITGRWFAQSEEERAFIILPQRRSILESNVMVSNGKRLVLAEDDFEIINDGKCQLKMSTFQRLQKIASDLQVCS